MRSVQVLTETHTYGDASECAAIGGVNPMQIAPRKPRRSKARRGVSDGANELVNTNVPVPTSKKVGQNVCEHHSGIADHAPSPNSGGAVSGGHRKAVSHLDSAPHNQAESGQLAGEDPSTCAASIDGDQLACDDQPTPVPVDALCDSLIIPDRQRRAAMKTTIMLENQLAAYSRSMLGYNAFNKDTCDSIKERAEKLVKAIVNGEPTDEDRWIVSAVRLQYEAVKPSLDSLAAIRKEAEKDMKAIAAKLPVFGWVKSIKGFGGGNLAYIVAATGNLSKYSTVSKVWKRLGLAVFEGDRQGSPKSKSAEDYIRHGYNKHRRCVAYLLQSSLIKAEGPYKAIYDARKVYELTRVETKLHAHNRAMRYMVKRAIADLWGQWNGTTNGKRNNP